MKFTFIVQKKGDLIIAKKNTHLNNDIELESLYRQSKSMGWVIVADQIKAKSAHRAAMKFFFLHDSHRIMLLICAVNVLLLLLVSNFIVNIFLATVCFFGYVYSIWVACNSQSPRLRALSRNDNLPVNR